LPDFFTAAKFYSENKCQLDETVFYLSTRYGIEGPPTWNVFNKDGSIHVGEVDVDPNTYEGKFVFTEPGEYLVEMKVKQVGRIETDRQTIIIHSLPELNFRDNYILCKGGSVDLDAGDGAFYSWSDNKNLLTRVRSIRKEGTYSVHVTHNNGCTKSDETQIIEKPLPVVERILAVDASCGHNNGSITIFPEKDTSEYIFDWKEFQDSSGSVLRNLIWGVYNVDVISKETGCRLPQKITISEIGSPEITIIPSVLGPICPGTEIMLTAEGADEYQWVNPSDSIEDSVTINPYFSETFVVQGYATDINGEKCYGLGEIPIDVLPYDPPELGEDLFLCEGEEQVLDGQEKYNSWDWNNIDNEKLFNVDKGYEELILTVQDQNGCLLTDTISVTIKPNPVINLGKDRSICFGEPYLLDGGVADKYKWNNGETSQFVNVSTSGLFAVKTTLNDCIGEAEVYIQVNNPDSLLARLFYSR